MDTTTPQAEERLLGQTLAGKYHLTEIQGRGAFGTVFKAQQYFCRQFVRQVAVKVSRQTGLTDQSAPYLFSDALILAQLLVGDSHLGKRHLVPIYDMGLLPECDGRGFLVMEYIEGHPLFTHIRVAGRIGAATGLRYAREICQGLAFVHARGAVHRDLKPDNVLIDRSGVVRLVDFGLATFTDPKLGFAPGSMGTYTYMAPETLAGRSTAAADVYGLGLLFYELFTGGGPHLTAPWPAPNEDKRDDLQRIKEGLRFAPPSEVHNEIRNEHRWLDDLILRCLATDPARRFRDAGQVLAAIEQRGVEHADARAEQTLAPAPAAATEEEQVLREVRRFLAARAFDQVIDRLDIHRPAEWAVVNLHGARVLRLLGLAYLGRADWHAARDCLEQLRAVQNEQSVLPKQEYAAALSDLVKCYRALGLPEPADDCQQEARRLSQTPD